MNYYILDDNNQAVRAENATEWAQWFETNGDKRRVASTTTDDGARVSTVFLGIDHSFLSDGPPLLFETMVFRVGWNDERCERCSTWEQAVAQHATMVAAIGGTL